MLLHLFPLYLLGVLNILVGILVLFRDKKRMSNLAFFGVIASVGVWCIGIAAYFTVSSPDDALRWMQLYYIAPLVLVYSLVVFALTFPGKRTKHCGVITLALPIISGVGLILFLPHLLIKNLVFVGQQRTVFLNFSHYYLYAAIVVLYFLLGLCILYIRSKEQSLTGRQLRVFFVGAFLSTVFGLYFNLIIPAVGNYRLIWVGPAATAIFIGVITLVMTRYKMFDIRTFVLRTFVYVLTMAVLAVAYVAPVVFLLSILLNVPFYWHRFIPAVIIATITAACFQVIQRWFNKATNRIFFRNAYDATDAIGLLNKALASSLSVTEILEQTSKIMTDTLRPDYVNFILTTDDEHTFRAFGNLVNANGQVMIKYLHATFLGAKEEVVNLELDEHKKTIDTAMDFPSVAVTARLVTGKQKNKTYLGYMILGSRKSGRAYSAADLKYVSSIVSVLAVALQNALHYEEIQQFNETLQQRVEEATRKLKASNDKLRKMDEAKDEFISMASHQLRTPLTSVKGYISMVLDGDAGPISDQQHELLQQSFLSSQRMANLISDLLNLSRINTGKFVMELAPVDLRQVIETELEQLRETAESKGLTLTYTSPETFPVLLLDENKMHQVIMNLVDNAIYYTYEGGSITLKLTETPSAVEFRVVDTGIGVPRDDQKHLFGKMFRAENARRARPDGTGLGLFMIRKVVVAQGGAIIFDSVEGKGSTFGFHFNKKDHEVDSAKSETPAHQPETASIAAV